jgi:mono/diheme cytochrome c family protein
LKKKNQDQGRVAHATSWPLCLCGSILLLGIAAQARAEGTPNYAQVHAVFAKHCVSCHNAKDEEGELVLESYAALMKGGETGPAVVPGKGDESLLLKLIRHEKKPYMPPPKKGPKLSDAEIAVVKAWVDAGALAGEVAPVAQAPTALPKVEPRVAPRKAVNAVAFAAGPKLYAVACYGEVELRSAADRSLVRRLAGHKGNVNAVVFSADGSLLVAAAGHPGVVGDVRVWNTADGTLVRAIEGHKDAVYGVALSPDGNTIATGSYDQAIKLWSRADGKELRTLTGHNGCVYDVAFRSDGKVLASASADRTVKLWDVATGTRLDTFSEPLKDQYAVAWSPDGARVAAAGVDNRIRVWSVSAAAKEGTNRLLVSRFAHEGAILRLAWSGDGKTILSSADDRTVKLWDAGGEVTARLALPPQPDWPTAVALAGGSVIVGRPGGSVDFFDAGSGTLQPPPPAPKPEVASVMPRGAKRGQTTRVRVAVKNLAALTEAKSGNPKLVVKLAPEPGPAPGVAWIEVSPAPDFPLGAHSVTLAAPGGIATFNVFVEDLPQVAEQEPNDTLDRAPTGTPTAGAGTLMPAPVSFWGAFDRRGDVDHFSFDAKAGQKLVLDVAAKRLGSKADVVLTLSDASGRALASAHDTDGDPDPLLLFTAPADGRYVARVTDLLSGASNDHYYRLSVGDFPVVTGAFPLGVPPNAETTVRLTGYNLPEGATATVKAGTGGEAAVPVDENHYRVRRTPKVMVDAMPAVREAEPNDSPDHATAMATPGVADGVLAAPSPKPDVDLYRFEARAGQTWVIETLAARRGSPADTKVEVLHPDGTPAERVLLRGVRDTYNTFRPIDANQNGARLQNWEEMEQNQYLYMQGEVVKLLLPPRGPDSQWDFFAVGGKRRCYFDTSATSHALDEPCYVVEPREPSERAKLPANGLPVFTIYYANDDDEERKLGTDSRLRFTAPADGAYLVRVTDTRGLGGERCAYRLVVREAKPDFNVALEGVATRINAGTGRSFLVRADRVDGFDGPVAVQIDGTPAGFRVASPLVIEGGQLEAFGTVWAAPGAKADDAAWKNVKVTATAVVDAKVITKPVNAFPKVEADPAEAPLYVDLLPTAPDGKADAAGSQSEAPAEVTIVPGHTTTAWIRTARKKQDGPISFDVQNLPHGVIVMDIGLNGVLIPEGQAERQIFLQCAPWVAEQDRLCYARAREAGNPTSRPVMLHVRKAEQQAARGRD